MEIRRQPKPDQRTKDAGWCYETRPEERSRRTAADLAKASGLVLAPVDDVASAILRE
jgi:hypothetical protein